MPVAFRLPRCDLPKIVEDGDQAVAAELGGGARQQAVEDGDLGDGQGGAECDALVEMGDEEETAAGGK